MPTICDTELLIDQFDWIRRCALMMAHDSGCINREQTEREWLREADPFLSYLTPSELRRLDSWLGSLSPEQRETLMTGEYEEILAIESGGPRREGSGWLLSHVFCDLL